LFSVGIPEQRLQISTAAVNSKQLLEVKEWFRKYVGTPLDYDEFVRLTEEAETQ
jgi:hypothetical protein